MRKLKISEPVHDDDSSSLDIYLREIGSISLLSQEEEHALFERIKNGDSKALEILTTANLRFVVAMAKHYQNRGLSLPDLINEGNIGLIKAARKFNGQGKFLSFAGWWVRQSIVKSIAESGGAVRLSTRQLATARSMSKDAARFEQSHGRRPNASEMSEQRSVPQKEVRHILGALTRTVSADAPVKEGSCNNLIDMIAADGYHDADSRFDVDVLRSDLVRGLDMLNERERMVLVSFFGIGQTPATMREIADKMGLRRERVRQIRDKALRRLRKSTDNRVLRSCLTK